jgi:lipopolysaccharide transport system ATP-binding protein
MYVRLAFAVAAHLESEILIVDEVLAVGDAEFQKKCLGKMGEVSKGEGRTVLFVSHNLISVKKLCNEGIVLFEGKNFLKAPIDLALNSYLSLQENQTYNTTLIFEKNLNLPMQIESVALADYDNGVIFKSSNQIVFVFEVNVISNIEASYIAINVYDNDDQLVYWTADFESDRFVTEKVGRFSLKCKLPNNILTAGKYKANFAIFSPIKGVVQYDEAKNISFKVEDNNDFLNQFNINYPGKTAVPSNWNLI